MKQPHYLKLFIIMFFSFKLYAETLVGGWYPIFFNQFNKTQLNTLINNYNHGRVKRVTLTYDKNSILASQISEYIQANSTLKLNIEKNSSLDTPETKYEHDKVIITVYSKL